MANRFCNIDGSQTIASTFDDIPAGFQLVQDEIDEIVDNIETIETHDPALELLTYGINPQRAPYNAVGDGVTNDASAVSLAATAAQIAGSTLIIARPYYLGASFTFDAAIREILFIGEGRFILDNNHNIVINCPFSGEGQIFQYNGAARIEGSPVIDGIKPEWFGADGTWESDEPAFLYAGQLFQETNIAVVGKRRFTYEVNPAFGEYGIDGNFVFHGNACTIHNIGEGIGINLHAADDGFGYYQIQKNFRVTGTLDSNGGIFCSPNTSYTTFIGVKCTGHGGVGFAQRACWGNRFFYCDGDENGLSGWNFTWESGDPGVTNGTTLYNCNARHNGGTGNEAYMDGDSLVSDLLHGGVRLKGAASFNWEKGIVESNNAFGFIIGTSASVATRVINIRPAYTEYHPRPDSASEVGAVVYQGAGTQVLNIDAGWTAIGSNPAVVGSIGYLLFRDPGVANLGKCVINPNAFVTTVSGYTSAYTNGDNFPTIMPNGFTDEFILESGSDLGCNIIKNSAFTLWDVGAIHYPIGWSVIPTVSGGTPIKSSSTPHSIGFSCSISDDSGGSGRGLRQLVKCKVGARYRIQFSYKGTDTPNRFTLSVNNGSDGAAIRTYTDDSHDGNWTNIAFDFTATEATHYIYYRVNNLWGGGSKSVYLYGLTMQQQHDFMVTTDNLNDYEPVDNLIIHSAYAPTLGDWLVGDEIKNNSSVVGEPIGWICTTAGTPGTWTPYGQLGYRSGDGTPVGSVVPFMIGEEYWDSSSTGTWYKSFGLNNTNWKALN